jgi:hypothetical protein
MGFLRIALQIVGRSAPLCQQYSLLFVRSVQGLTSVCVRTGQNLTHTSEWRLTCCAVHHFSCELNMRRTFAYSSNGVVSWVQVQQRAAALHPSTSAPSVETPNGTDGGVIDHQMQERCKLATHSYTRRTASSQLTITIIVNIPL